MIHPLHNREFNISQILYDKFPYASVGANKIGEILDINGNTKILFPSHIYTQSFVLLKYITRDFDAVTGVLNNTMMKTIEILVNNRTRTLLKDYSMYMKE